MERSVGRYKSNSLNPRIASMIKEFLVDTEADIFNLIVETINELVYTAKGLIRGIRGLVKLSTK